jgi:hypothetical protein
MDATAQRARDREAFREFLEKHHYAPQVCRLANLLVGVCWG